MSGRPTIPDEFWPLLDAACSGRLTREQWFDLEACLEGSPEAQEIFIDHVLLCTQVNAWWKGERSCLAGLDRLAGSLDGDAGAVLRSIRRSFECRAAGSEEVAGAAEEAAVGVEYRAPAPPVEPLLAVSVPADWSFAGVLCAYLSFLLLIATALAVAWVWNGPRGDSTGIAATAVRASQPREATRSAPQEMVVGRVTSLSHCEWSDPNTAAREGEEVAPGRKLRRPRASWESRTPTGRNCCWPVRPFTRWNHITVDFLDSANSASCSKKTLWTAIRQERRVANNRQLGIESCFGFVPPVPGWSPGSAGEFRVSVNESGESSVYVREGKVATWATRPSLNLTWRNGRADPTVVYGAGEEGHFRPRGSARKPRLIFGYLTDVCFYHNFRGANIMLRCGTVILCAFGLLCGCAAVASATSFVDLSALTTGGSGYFNAYPTGITSSGAVSLQGLYNGGSAYYHTWLYSGGTAGSMTDISTKLYSGGSGRITTMNASGQMSEMVSSAHGSYWYSGGTNGTAHAIPLPTGVSGVTSVYAYGMDNAGELVGSANGAYSDSNRAFVYSGGTAGTSYGPWECPYDNVNNPSIGLLGNAAGNIPVALSPGGNYAVGFWEYQAGGTPPPIPTQAACVWTQVGGSWANTPTWTEISSPLYNAKNGGSGWQAYLSSVAVAVNDNGQVLTTLGTGNNNGYIGTTGSTAALYQIGSGGITLLPTAFEIGPYQSVDWPNGGATQAWEWTSISTAWWEASKRSGASSTPRSGAPAVESRTSMRCIRRVAASSRPASPSTRLPPLTTTATLPATAPTRTERSRGS